MNFLAYAMGGGGTGGAGGQGGGIGAFLPLILMFAIFYFLLIRPQQKKAKQHKLLLSALKKGDRGIWSPIAEYRILNNECRRIRKRNLHYSRFLVRYSIFMALRRKGILEESEPNTPVLQYSSTPPGRASCGTITFQ